MSWSEPHVEACQVPSCDLPRHARGLCQAHYIRHRKGSSLGSPVRSPLVGDVGARMLAGVEFDTNGGCWLWKYAAANGGYGVLYLNRRLVRAHRAAYQEWVGEIGNGLKVCHRCDTPACINPTHLFLGTQADNVADMCAKGRKVNAPSKGEANGSAVLTERQALAIIAAAEQGETFTSIGARFGVSRVTAAKIAKRQGWKHLGADQAA